MRYLVIKKENSSPEIIIWPKSLHRIPLKNGQTQESSHRDYLRSNNIPFEKVSSVGNVYCNPETKQTDVSVLAWDTPAPPSDKILVEKEVVLFTEKHPELTEEIQKDWDKYQDWLRKSKEILASLGK